MRQLFRLFIAALFASLLAGCGYNEIQRLDEGVKAAWSETLNQYQRRADLVPQLVESVNAYMVHERELLAEVTAARSRVGSINVSPDRLPTEEEMAQFQAAQSQLTSALSRLIAVSENYPDLKADGLFRDLNVQLEGTENRIATARGRYIREVQGYNTYIRQFPTLITAKIFGYKVLPNFGVENQDKIMQRPTIQFDNPRSAPAQ
ncbi:LemA family [Oligella ureolytica]|uniref:LemA family n=1 Tax=Oligella ureolytica TaxID=90244 RepID=A0A378XFH1_9BURK|nr:LemA family protein [Oligella ureolytica]NLP32836.1 LemA family protein [Oligella ureolytica]QPT39074.1 LemA family protein [Oligella ureolytica]SUA54712.1 LemA family [Oligella ureolytica]